MLPKSLCTLIFGVLVGKKLELGYNIHHVHPRPLLYTTLEKEPDNLSNKEAKGRNGRPNLDYDNDLPKYQRVHVITVALLPLSAALDRTFGSPCLPPS